MPKTKTGSAGTKAFQEGLKYYVYGLLVSAVVTVLVPLLVSQYASLFGLVAVKDLLTAFILVIVTAVSFFRDIAYFFRRESKRMLSGIIFAFGVVTISCLMTDWLELCAVLVATILVIFYRLQEQTHDSQM